MSGPSPLRELTLARIRSFLREPEALFWTFGFPIIMSIGLGLAFRERPSERAVVGIERGSIAERYAPALSRSDEVELTIISADSADRAIRKGDIAVLLAGRDALTYRYDPARAKSRSAQLIADRVVQRAAGSTDPVPSINDRERRPSGRYIDWVIPGLIGMNLMSTGMWGMGFGLVQMRQKKQILPGFRGAIAFTSTRSAQAGLSGCMDCSAAGMGAASWPCPRHPFVTDPVTDKKLGQGGSDARRARSAEHGSYRQRRSEAAGRGHCCTSIGSSTWPSVPRVPGAG